MVWIIYMVLVFMVFFLCCREGQPLKLPETKKTLQFTFNGEGTLADLFLSHMPGFC